MESDGNSMTHVASRGNGSLFGSGKSVTPSCLYRSSTNLDRGYSSSVFSPGRKTEYKLTIYNFDGYKIILIVVSSVVQEKSVLVGRGEGNLERESVTFL